MTVGGKLLSAIVPPGHWGNGLGVEHPAKIDSDRYLLDFWSIPDRFLVDIWSIPDRLLIDF